MRIALEDLHLEQLVVFYPGNMTYELATKARVVPIDVLVSGSMKTVFPKRALSRHPDAPLGRDRKVDTSK